MNTALASSQAPAPRSERTPEDRREPLLAILDVMDVMGLDSERHPVHTSAILVWGPSDPEPLAAFVLQGATARADRTAIEAIKSLDRALPIVYVAHQPTRRRETSVRRLSIHYLLNDPIDRTELSLVIEALVRATAHGR